MCTSSIEPKLRSEALSSRESTSTNGGKRPQKPHPNTSRTSWRLRKQRILSLLLDSATAIFVAQFIYNNPSYLNPWQIPNSQLWILGFVLIRCAIAFYDHLVVFLIEKFFRCQVLPTRQPGAPPVRYVKLDMRSVIYLSINSFNEYAFVMRLTHYLWNGGYRTQLPSELSQLTLGNTIVAIGIMFVSMDLLYAPLHHLLHLPSLYPFIHKHHHRQHFPVRGYLDAGNEHPIEHMIGVVCTWFAVCSAEMLLPTLSMLWEVVKNDGESSLADFNFQGGGVHAITVFVFFQVHAALAMMNHSPFDASFSLPFVGSTLLFGNDNVVLRIVEQVPFVGMGLGRVLTGRWFNYSVGHHEMHHRKFNYNYAQYCMFYDLWMGTFLEYEGPICAAELEARKNSKYK
ncbi:hypothetical protein HJC23_003217 [Cyclotella cryptica]|uniref:Fatty acid hydroxylase domain-containing protein n=1 Tax=Cyclotella cryptica TaxID=29204 RepID=A0ABD3PD90_9STRA